MPAGPYLPFTSMLNAVVDQTIDLENDAFRFVLLDADAAEPDQTTDVTWSDLSAGEVETGDDYATHGKAVNLTKTTSGYEVAFGGAAVVWPSSNLTGRFGVIVRDANSDGDLAGTDLLVSYVVLNTNAALNNGTVTSTNSDFSVGTAKVVRLNGEAA